MNKIELLEEMYEMAVHNWICYSKNLTLAEAKKGYEREWEESKEKIELLQEMIEEQKYKENIKLSHVQILKTYPNMKYFVMNSNGGLLAGAYKFIEAKKYAEKYKKEYKEDILNNKLGVYVFDKEGTNLYVAKGTKKALQEVEEEEFE